MAASIDQFKALVSSKSGLARNNQFSVSLPTLPGATSRDINLLCKEASLPGRQIFTYDKTIGTKIEKVAYGAGYTDLSLSFWLMNDYGIKKYFETWAELAYNPNTYQIGYKNEYTADITVSQLKRGIGFPVYSTPLGIPSLSSTVQNRLPRIGPVDLAQGELDIDFTTPGTVVYRCNIFDAFPVTLEEVPLTNDKDAIVEYRVTLAYTKWESEFPQQTSDFGATVLGTVATRLFS